MVLGIDMETEVAGYPLVVVLVGSLYALVLTSVLVGFLSRRAHKPEEVASWAAAHGLRLTSANRGLVRYYVQLAIVTRCIGAVAAMYLGFAFDRAFGLDTSAGPGWWAWVLGGWTVGALWAQHQVASGDAGPALASLTPRRLADYLPVSLRLAPAVAVVMVAACTIAVRASATIVAADADPIASWAVLARPVAVAVVVVLLVLVAELRIVARRQAPLDADRVAADDAIRTSAIHQVAGAGTALICLLGLINYGAVVGSYGIRTPGWTAIVPITLGVGTIVFWRYFTYRAWRVRRSVTVTRRGPIGVST